MFLGKGQIVVHGTAKLNWSAPFPRANLKRQLMSSFCEKNILFVVVVSHNEILEYGQVIHTHAGGHSHSGSKLRFERLVAVQKTQKSIDGIQGWTKNIDCVPSLSTNKAGNESLYQQVKISFVCTRTILRLFLSSLALCLRKPRES